ncbi:MAG: MFS transporter [Caulobacteraceae bacterium]
MSAAAETPAIAKPASNVRWVVLTLLFLAMVINYVDRQTLAFLKPTLQGEFGWSETNYADIIFWFQATYAASYLIFGRLVDRVGSRWGFAIAFGIWQLAYIVHGWASGLGGFIAARMGLGVGEGGAFPGAIKAVAEWFPKRERAFANGLFNAGTNIGAVVTPLLIPMIVLSMGGWREAFFIVGAAGLIWLPIWIIMYRRPREKAGVSESELAWIEQDPADPPVRISWLQLLRYRETWAYALGKFLIDPIWWMFLFWLPDFLGKRYGLDLKTFGPPVVAIYLLSDVGSVSGGWLSSQFMKMGWSINRARKTTMLICAICALPVAFAANASSLWVAVAIIGLATAAHQGFSATLYTLPADVFPRAAVGSVVGIGGMIGGVGGMVFSKYTGAVLDQLGTYTPIFIVAASAYTLALIAVHLLTPRMEPVKIEAAP